MSAAHSPRRLAPKPERVTVYFPRDVATRLRVRCAEGRQSISDAVSVAVQAWLAEGRKVSR